MFNDYSHVLVIMKDRSAGRYRKSSIVAEDEDNATADDNKLPTSFSGRDT